MNINISEELLLSTSGQDMAAADCCENSISICQTTRLQVWESGGIAPPFLISVLGGSEWSASWHCPLPTGKEPPVSTGYEAGVGPRKSLDAVEKKKIPCPCGESKPRPSRLSYPDSNFTHDVAKFPFLTWPMEHWESLFHKITQEDDAGYFTHSQAKRLWLVMFVSELSQRHLPAI
jgi:hypothetical protein